MRLGEEMQRLLVHRMGVANSEAQRLRKNQSRLEGAARPSGSTEQRLGRRFLELLPLEPVVFDQHRTKHALRTQPSGDAFEHE